MYALYVASKHGSSDATKFEHRQVALKALKYRKPGVVEAWVIRMIEEYVHCRHLMLHYVKGYGGINYLIKRLVIKPKWLSIRQMHR